MADVEVNVLCKRANGEFCCDEDANPCSLGTYGGGTVSGGYALFTAMPSGVGKPDATISAGDWTPVGGPGSLHLCVDDEPDAISDTDYMQCSNSSNSTGELGLPVLFEGNLTVYYRYRKGAAGGNSRDVQVALYNGGSLVTAGTNHTGISENWTNGSFTASSPAAWTDLRIRVISGGTTGGQSGNRRTVDVSYVHFQANTKGGFVGLLTELHSGPLVTDPLIFQPPASEIADAWSIFSLDENKLRCVAPGANLWAGTVGGDFGVSFFTTLWVRHEETVVFQGGTDAEPPNSEYNLRFDPTSGFANRQLWYRLPPSATLQYVGTHDSGGAKIAYPLQMNGRIPEEIFDIEFLTTTQLVPPPSYPYDDPYEADPDGYYCMKIFVMFLRTADNFDIYIKNRHGTRLNMLARTPWN